MSAADVILSLYILLELVTVNCYKWTITAAGGRKVKTFVVRYHEYSFESTNGEYVITASLSDCGSQVMFDEPLDDECQEQNKRMLIFKKWV